VVKFTLQGKKSNNTIYNATSAGIITEIKTTSKKGGYTLTIEKNDGSQATEVIPPGPDLIVSQGQTIKIDEPLTNNPNVGGFGQTETEIVLQYSTRIQGLLLFFTFTIIAQVFLVLKKKQFEKVQLAEMNF